MGASRPSLWPPAGGRVPLVLKLAMTAFMAVFVPVCWRAVGPTNFLYFCDVSLFLTLAAVWAEWSLPASMAAVGLLLPQTLWVVDFLAALCGGKVTGMTGYVFDPRMPLVLRELSLFHGWLPMLVLFLVWRLGYDRRALVAWTALGWSVMLVCYLWMPLPPAPKDDPNEPVNINYVFGLGMDGPQQWMPPPAWLALTCAAYLVVLWLPVHLLLCWLARPAASRQPAAAPA